VTSIVAAAILISPSLEEARECAGSRVLLFDEMPNDLAFGSPRLVWPDAHV
jgi:hypothetical protein